MSPSINVVQHQQQQQQQQQSPLAIKQQQQQQQQVAAVQAAADYYEQQLKLHHQKSLECEQQLRSQSEQIKELKVNERERKRIAVRAGTLEIFISKATKNFNIFSHKNKRKP
jgi:hypothetical protein